jgi:hypothetical protein
MNIYYYIYYKLYKFVCKTNKGIAEWASMIFYSLLLFFNIVTVLYYLHLLKSGVLVRNGQGVMVSTEVFLLIINYALFIRNRRYLKVLKKYSNETNTYRFIGSFLVILYIILSYYFFFHALDIM